MNRRFLKDIVGNETVETARYRGNASDFRVGGNDVSANICSPT